jgi:Zn-dependent protease with chaperone function
LSNRVPFARFALGIVSGLTIGYTLARVSDMLADQSSPAPAKERDPKRYGQTRRLLMVVGHARAAASGAMLAFGLSDVFERKLKWVPLALRLPVFVGLLTAIEAAREWPIEYIEEYQLERIFGNSERTPEAWANDRLKATLIGGGVGMLLSGIAGTIMRRAPKRWPWIVIAGMPALMAFANVVAPTFIMPLFNKYIPLEGPLEQRIRELAARYGVGGATILRFDMSRQSKKANAFVTGVFGTERIALADTLLDEFAEDETLFVVAHELGHYVKRDPWVAIALGTGLIALPLLIGNAVVRRTTGRDVGDVGTSMRLGFYLSLGQIAALPIANAFSRMIERRADRFAVEATNDAASGARAFRRLRDQNLAEDEGPKWSEVLFSSHPSLGSRIAALENGAATASK